MIAQLPYVTAVILLLVMGIWTVRDTVAGYDDLFDLFDTQIEEELALYTSMVRPSTLAQHDFRQLFNGEAAFERYRTNLRRIIFNRTEFVLIALAILFAATAAAIIFFFLPHLMYFFGVLTYPLIFLVGAFWGLYWLVLIIFIVGVLHLFLGIMRAIILLSDSKDDLRIWSYIMRLRGQKVKGEFMSYEQFFDNASVIGRFIYRVTYRLILILVSGAILLIAVDYLNPNDLYLINPLSWPLSFGIILAGFLIFIIPQVALHNFLTEMKDSVLNGLERGHSRLSIEFFECLEETQQTYRSSRTREIHEQRRRDIELLRQMIHDNRESPTWSFRMPAALKILFASILPILVLVIEIIIRVFVLTS